MIHLLTFLLSAVTAFAHPQDPDKSMSEIEIAQWGVRNTGDAHPWIIDQYSRIYLKGIPGEDIEWPTQTKKPVRKVRVAVIDTGVDILHPQILRQTTGFQLGAAVSPDATPEKVKECDLWKKFRDCYQEREAAFASGLEFEDKCEEKYIRKENDLDGNGYPLDCFGWNMADETIYKNTSDQTHFEEIKVHGEYLRGIPYVYDDVGHGTHVAGITGANKNGLMNSPSGEVVQLIPVKMLKTAGPGSPGANDQGVDNEYVGTRLTDVAAMSIFYAIDSGAEVINMSLGWPHFVNGKLIIKALQEARKKNVLIVAAAGNDSSDFPVFPCSFEGVICVGASHFDGRPAHFSNYGAAVDLFAPGHYIFSTIQSLERGVDFTSFEGYDFNSGTSMAAPFVAGALAYCISQGHSAQDCRARLIIGTRPIPGPNVVPKSIFNGTFKKYAQGQNLSVKRALEAEVQPLIYLEDKSVRAIQFNPSEQRTELQLELRNIWSDASQVEILAEIDPIDAAVSLAKSSFRFSDWKSNESQTLKLEFSYPKDGWFESQMRLKLNVEATDAKSGKKYSRVVWVQNEFVRRVSKTTDADTVFPVVDASGSSKTISLSSDPVSGDVIEFIDTAQRNSTSAREREFILWSHINPVGAPPEKLTYLDWSVKQVREDSKNKKFVLSEVNVIKKPHKDAGVERIVKLDANFDGVEDYIVFGLAPGIFVQNGNQIEVKDRYWYLMYFNSSWKPLEIINSPTGKTHLVRFEEKVTTLPLFDVQWIKVGERLSPAWINYGKKALEEQAPWENVPTNSPWARTPFRGNPGDLKKLYFISDTGLRTISSPAGYSYVDFFQSSMAQMKAGVATTLLSKGQQAWQEYFSIEIKNPKEVITKNKYLSPYKSADETLTAIQLGEYQALRLSFRSRYRLLDDSLSTSPYLAYLSQGNPGTIRWSTIQNTPRGWKSEGSEIQRRMNPLGGEDRSEVFLRLGGIFSEGSSARTRMFALSLYDLVFFDIDAQGNTQRVEQTLRRYSFLPGETFDKTFYPVLVEISGVLHPGVSVPQGAGVSTAFDLVTPVYNSATGTLSHLMRPARFRFYSSLKETGCLSIPNAFEGQLGQASTYDFICGNEIRRINLSK